MSDFLAGMDNAEAAARLAEITKEREVRLDWKPFAAAREAFQNLPDLTADTLDFSGSHVTIGNPLAADDPNLALIRQAAQAVMPWKKGPFNLFGLEIDAEWRSDLKWDRFADALPSQAGKVVLDLGANNGYYMFRTAAQSPDFVLGIDPFPRLWYQFQLMQRYAALPRFEFQMWGWEEVGLLEGQFDTCFCMGIIYHHFNPIQILKDIYAALKPGGLLVLETIIVPGEDPSCLFPEDRYAMMRNVWFVPTLTSTRNFLKRTKFVDIEVVAVNQHKAEEQRTTAWNPGWSYQDFVSDDNPNLTKEGHPAPHRAVLFARKKG